MERTEFIILKSLVENPEYSKQVSPFIEERFFDDMNAKNIAKKYSDFVVKYKNVPNYEEIVMGLTKDPRLSDAMVTNAIEEIEKIKSDNIEDFTVDALVDMTEHHFQEVALEYAITKGAEILASEEKRIQKSQLPDMMRDALKISFKNSIGQLYASENSIKDQYYFYHHKDHKFPLPDWNTLTSELKGGCSKKKIHLFLAGTSVGKTLALINVAIQLVKAGCNVLYVSAEISENDIVERLDGNLLDTKTQELPIIEKEKYVNKLRELRNQSDGKLVVKEYPTAFANVNHIRTLMDELEIKEDFKPDFLILDYLNIFGSTRFKNIGDTYTLVKAVTEEFRGLAIDKNIGVWSATQTNRCLGLNTIVETKDKGKIKIKNIKENDKVLTKTGFENVNKVYPIEKNKCYKIKLKNGKTISCSGKHLFPTKNNKLKSINNGLKKGDFLQIK